MTTNANNVEIVSYNEYWKRARRNKLLKILAPGGPYVNALKRVTQIVLVHVIVALVTVLWIDVMFNAIISFAFTLEIVCFVLIFLMSIGSGGSSSSGGPYIAVSSSGEHFIIY